MTRRQFLIGSLPFLSLSFSVRCGHGIPVSDRSFTSTVTLNHDHGLTITQSSWLSPPEAGQTFATTNNLMHTHQVFLTHNKLLKIGQGERISVTSGVTNNHTHEFTLVLREG